MLSKIERSSVRALESRDMLVVLEGAHDVQSQLDLKEAFVEIRRGAIRVKSRPRLPVRKLQW
jgi:hypothetical protein